MSDLNNCKIYVQNSRHAFSTFIDRTFTSQKRSSVFVDTGADRDLSRLSKTSGVEKSLQAL